MIKPYFLLGDLRITRPTVCTTSTYELRAERNKTASSVGTSTPSLKQRTLVRIRHSLGVSPPSLSHPSSSSRLGADIVPSMCSEATDTICSFLASGNELI